ncbi:hypothetical protein PMAYCL1PPCAC_26508, partial [Pristionchus mayeri]
YMSCCVSVDAQSGAQSHQHQLVIGSDDDNQISNLTSAQMLATAVVVSLEWAQRKRRGGSHEAVLKKTNQLSIDNRCAAGLRVNYLPFPESGSLPYLNSDSEQGLLVPPHDGSVSSLLSPQSFSESHIHRLGMHLKERGRSKTKDHRSKHTPLRSNLCEVAQRNSPIRPSSGCIWKHRL